MCLFVLFFCFFFKQKTAYEMRINDWSSDVCSSDLGKFTQLLLVARTARYTPQVGNGSLHDPVNRYILGQEIEAAGKARGINGTAGEMTGDVEGAAERWQIHVMTDVRPRHPLAQCRRQVAAEAADQAFHEGFA